MTTYFVKVGGDGSAVTTDPGTGGDWSGAFDSVDVALDTASAGDDIRASNLHSKDLAATVTMASAGTVALPVTITSVDNDDTSVFLAGAEEGTVTTGGLNTTGYIDFVGVFVDSYGVYKTTGGVNIIDGGLRQRATTARSFDVGADSCLTVKGSTIKFGHAGSGFDGEARSRIDLIGCTLDPAGIAVDNLFVPIDNQCIGTVIDCNLAHMTASPQLVKAPATSSAMIDIVFARVKTPTGMTVVSGLDRGDQRVACYGVGTDAEHAPKVIYAGEESPDTAIYRTLGGVNSAGDGFSIEAISSSAASFHRPLKVELGSFYIDTADYTADIEFKVHFAVDGSAVALDSSEFYFEIEHPDGADNVLGVLADTKAAPLATGAAPTTETSLWTGLSGTNKQMSASKSIAIGGSAGQIASGLVRVNACLCKPSQTVFICKQVEVS